MIPFVAFLLPEGEACGKIKLIESSGKQGDYYYVSPNGSDRNNGSLRYPWATVQHAATKAKPGDTVLIRGGIYNEGEIWLRADHGHGGTQGKLLTIQAYPGERPIFVNASRPLIIECDYIRIEGLHLKNGKSIGVDGNTVQIANNSFTGSGYAWAAVDAGGTNILLEGNICDIKGNTVGTQGHCYYISHSSNMTIRNNVAKGMTGYGIHVFDQRRSQDPPGFERLIKNVIIEGNTVSHSQERSGIILAAYDHARIENVIIRNNVLFNNAHSGIYIPGIVSNVKIYNNTWFGNGETALPIYGTTNDVANVEIKNNIFDLTKTKSSNAYHVSNEKGNTSLIIQNNLYWPKPLRLYKLSDSSPVIGDPHFVKPAEENFHLLPRSAAIDKGIPLSDVSHDKDGIKRPQGTAFDLGAFELH
ncbi:MAG: right-handed parallel beta-helix repeat-containing protein [Syntrophaceae bacterium]|nr:right-handed parallel beta-helix repeat-containing protein [Syntrophaceae bacterium]